MSKRVVKKRPLLFLIVFIVFCFCDCVQVVEGACLPRNGCSTALVHYRVQPNEDLSLLLARFQTTLDDVKIYNTDVINSSGSIQTGQGLIFPFSCGSCVGDQLRHSFTYIVEEGDTFFSISKNKFEGLSRVEWITQASGMSSSTMIYPGDKLQVPIPCFCGDPTVSPNFGLFTTYLAVTTDSASSLASAFSITDTLVQVFNPSVDWRSNLTEGRVLFIPSRNGTNGSFATPRSDRDASGYDAGNKGESHGRGIVFLIVVGGVALVLFILVLWLSHRLLSRRNRPMKSDLIDLEGAKKGGIPISGSYSAGGPSGMLKFSRLGWSRMPRFAGRSQVSRLLSNSGSGPLASSSVGSSGPLEPARRAGRSPLEGFTLDKSVEFSFEELAAATNNFNVANKIGEGGYGAVYLATLRGQKMAVKRMNVQATKEFICELQILTHVHHTHLVQLIGYCMVKSLFLIYELVENGPLERHLHDSPEGPLSWQARVQIALDTARGLEYIHEHTKPTYIHRDVKSSNILLDKELRAKVADFGLTKLTETGDNSVSMSMSYPMKLVGTYGYMPPEYAKYGDVSPKVDVYSFGVVLFEIISAKSAIVRTIEFSGDSRIPDKEDQKSLVGMFDGALKDSHDKEALRQLVDPALGGNYPLESAWKLARLAADCTQDNPDLRPDMRTVVLALMALTATVPDWEKLN